MPVSMLFAQFHLIFFLWFLNEFSKKLGLLRIKIDFVFYMRILQSFFDYLECISSKYAIHFNKCNEH